MIDINFSPEQRELIRTYGSEAFEEATSKFSKAIEQGKTLTNPAGYFMKIIGEVVSNQEENEKKKKDGWRPSPIEEISYYLKNISWNSKQQAESLKIVSNEMASLNDNLIILINVLHNSRHSDESKISSDQWVELTNQMAKKLD